MNRQILCKKMHQWLVWLCDYGLNSCLLRKDETDIGRCRLSVCAYNIHLEIITTCKAYKYNHLSSNKYKNYCINKTKITPLTARGFLLTFMSNLQQKQRKAASYSDREPGFDGKKQHHYYMTKTPRDKRMTRTLDGFVLACAQTCSQPNIWPN